MTKKDMALTVYRLSNDIMDGFFQKVSREQQNSLHSPSNDKRLDSLLLAYFTRENEEKQRLTLNFSRKHTFLTF